MTQYTLAWGKHVSPSFQNEVREICRSFGWSINHANWLMACMAFESGETFSPKIRNAAGSGACGLIQFMPSTAAGLGCSINELEDMTAEEQLRIVKLYFKPYYKKIFTLSDMYMAILLPKYVGKPEDSVLFSGGISYRQNSGLDINRDGKVTKAEATAKVARKLRAGFEDYNCMSCTW